MARRCSAAKNTGDRGPRDAPRAGDLADALFALAVVADGGPRDCGALQSARSVECTGRNPSRGPTEVILDLR